MSRLHHISVVRRNLRRRSLAAALSLTLGFPAVSLAFAQPTPTQPASTQPPLAQPAPTSLTPNAALYYWRGWFERDADFMKSITEKYNYKASDPDWKPSDELKKELDLHDGFIATIIRATKVGPCDFGVAYEDGYMALIPHVGLMRQCARMLGCDARRAWMDDKTDEAGERIAAIIRMSSHTKNDRLAISALVGGALFKDAMDETLAMQKAGKLTDTVKQSLAELVRRVPTDDPFGVKPALESERAISATYLRRRLNDDGMKVLEEMISLTDNRDEALRAKAKALTKETALKELDRMDQFFDQVLAAWSNPAERVAKVTALGEQVQAGEFGVLASIFAPSTTRLAESTKAHGQTVESFRTLLGVK